jgi:hypothetical protein
MYWENHGVRTFKGWDNGKMFALGAQVDPARPNCLSHQYAGNKLLE